jgi:HEAT repeat protein
MKILSLSALIAIALCTSAVAQQNTSKILTANAAQAISLIPTQNKQQLDDVMNRLYDLEDEDVESIINVLNSSDTATTAKLQYAIAAFSAYAMQQGREEWRSTAVRAYCNMLNEITDKNKQQFLITQLQLTGKDDAVECLQQYLSDEQLSGPAARALAQINTAAAENALLNSLKTAQGAARLNVVEALGFTKYKPAAPAIGALANTGDDHLQKVVLYSLATIGDAKSAAVLRTVAHKANYTLDNTEATPAYLLYLQTLAANGSGTVAEKLAGQLMQDSKDAYQQHTRTAALKLLVDIKKEKSLPDLQLAMKDNNDAYRAAALQFAMPYNNENTAKQWLKTASTLAPEAKAQVVAMLGRAKYKSLLPQYLLLLKDGDKDVRLAAITAAGKTGSEEALQPLLTVMTNGDTSEMAAVKEALLTMESKQLVTTLESSLPTVPAAAKADLLDVLAARGEVATVAGVFANGDAQTKNAAIKALGGNYSPESAGALYNISQLSGERNAHAIADAYIAMAVNAFMPADQKLLLLENATSMATTEDQKKQAIKEAGNCNTFLALVFTGNYLDSAGMQQEAAASVINIALNNLDYNSTLARGLLTKAASVINGEGADKKKEAVQKYLASMPAGQGFVSLFNGKDLSGWKGLVGNPIERAKMSADTLAKHQAIADGVMRDGWYAKDGLLHFTGHGDNICTQKQYGNFEMYVDWKILPQGDAGVYLRGTPQVQIWDTSRRDVGAEVGSGGLYNNAKYQSKPLELADNAIGDWNTFHIIMKEDKVTVYLNGVLVTDSIVLENYWNRNQPIFPKEQIELQAHGNHVTYRNIYIKDLDKPVADTFVLSEQEQKEGFKVLFDGTNLDNWTGNKTDYVVENGDILIQPQSNGHGNLYTNDEYSDFIFRFEFQLTPGANNGLGIRAPLEGDAAYVGMELQILDSEDPKYKDLKPYQYHGSLYGVVPAKRGYLKPVGEWNYEEVIVKGPKIKVVLNGTTILDADITKVRKNKDIVKVHPGLLNKTGHIGFLGHGDELRFRNIRIKDLGK